MNNKYQAPLLPGEFYHLFNRANTQGEKLFPQERNYRYFLQKWAEYLGDSMEVLAYCLIPNHFHFLIRVKGDNQRDNTPQRGVIPSIPESFRRFFITYTQAINKQEQRRGSLFQEHPKRLRVESDSHLLGLIRYIHNNPVHHGLVSSLENWRYSSYHAILSQTQSRVSREYVLELFGGRSAFIAFHQQITEAKEIAYCIVEE